MARAEAPPLNLTDSRACHDRASRVLAGGVTTAFRMFERPVPLFIESADGSRLVDVDGNEYVDFVCGFGPVILGHNHPAVSAAVMEAVPRLQQVGGQHRGEYELAEALCAAVPSFERIRLGLSGSEAVHAAVRLARAATKRDLIVKFAGHYHGWYDGALVGATTLPPAAPESAGQQASAIADIEVLDWNEPEAIRATFADRGSEIAAVIMEPLPCNQGVIYPLPGYLELVRDLASEAGALLIFDEVISGFRIGTGGAQAEFGVTPDLTVIAKAMANGFPISAFGGRSDLMELVATNDVVHAGTYNGGGISVAAALATIGVLRGEPAIYERMERLGQRLMTGLRELAAKHGHRLVTQGPGPVFFAWFFDGDDVRSFRDHLHADAQRYGRFAELMLGEGVRIIPAGRWYLTAAHDEVDISQALAAADRALAALGD